MHELGILIIDFNLKWFLYDPSLHGPLILLNTIVKANYLHQRSAISENAVYPMRENQVYYKSFFFLQKKYVTTVSFKHDAFGHACCIRISFSLFSNIAYIFNLKVMYDVK